MAQKPEATTSGTSSWITETDQYDIADEVEWACSRLQDAIKDERIARESLESLFKKRKEDALDGVKKAQQHLEFVNEEEARLRKAISDEKISIEKAPDTFGDDKKDGRDQAQKALRSLFQQLVNQNGPREKAESSAKVPSPLEVYLHEEEGALAYSRSSLKHHEENVKTLHQLIERFEKPGSITTRSLQQNSNGQRVRTVTDVVQQVEIDFPTEEDIVNLKKSLETKENLVQWELKSIAKKEAKIASYRRLIAASSSQ